MAEKSQLRSEYLKRRQSIGLEEASFAAAAIAQSALALVTEAQAVAGYVAVRGEVQVDGLMAELSARNIITALPGVKSTAEPLLFRVWKPGDALQKGAYGISEPLAAANAVAPSIILVPLLAFDRRGFRLGYGGGYYDRTLAHLRAHGTIRAIGIAYAAQEIAEIPDDPHDQRLDVIVTEKEIIRS